MAAIAAETARGARASGDVVSGALLASGAAALFVGTLFYARLTPELGLPALPAERTQALADALRLGPEALALAGGFAFLGDCLLLAACIALTSRQPPRGRSRRGRLGVDGGQRGARHGVRFDDRGALLAPGARRRLRACSSRSSRGSIFCSPPATCLMAWASSPSCARTSVEASRCCRGRCRMSESSSGPQRRSAGSARRLACCICRLSSASASRSAA